MAVSDQSVATGSHSSISCVSTRFAPFRWTRCRRRTRAIPERPWRLAPVAYCLWQQFLRYDPADPLWPNRDRFVLSNGHASMLLYSLMHLAGVREVSSRRRNSFDACRVARRHQEFPATGQQDAGASRIRFDHGRRDHHRPARSGRRQQRGHGDRRALAGRVFQSSGIRAVQLQRLGDLRRRRHDGRNFLGSRLDRRPSETFEPVLDLRQQPHHHRGQYRSRLRRKCGRPVRSLWLGCPARPRCQRSGRAGRCLHSRAQRDGSPQTDHRRQPHRLTARPTAKTQKRRTASRSAKKKSN